MRAVLMEIFNKIIDMNPTLANYTMARMAQNMLINHINHSMTDEEAMLILIEVKKILSKYNI